MFFPGRFLLSRIVDWQGGLIFFALLLMPDVLYPPTAPVRFPLFPVEPPAVPPAEAPASFRLFRYFEPVPLLFFALSFPGPLGVEDVLS